SYTDAPGAPLAKLTRTVARGQRVGTTFAARPLRDLGEATLTASDLKGPSGSIPAKRIDLRYFHHQPARGHNDVAYVLQPRGLRPVAGAGLTLGKDLTRQFLVTVDVPADAKPGLYAGEIVLAAGPLKHAVPIEIEVLDLELAPLDYPSGFFGLDIPGGIADPEATYRALFTLFRSHGMTTFSGGPGVTFQGFAADGTPRLDTAACDDYLRIARECGFTGEVFSYGGPGWIHGLYDGEHRQAWEASGKPFAELLRVVWTAHAEHAKAAGWQQINFGVIDEPRTDDGVKGVIDFLDQHRTAVPFLRLGGFYSVNWDDNHHGIQDIFGKTVWSGMGVWGAKDIAKAKELGVELYLYNQGADRVTMGALAWAARQRGIEGSICWHGWALHGYQYFDLDGREPDTAMVHWGKGVLYPTLHLARSAEGVADLRFAITLDRAARAAGDRPEAKEALAWLAGIVDGIVPGTRDLPPEIAGEDAFRDGCIERLRKLAER
ncbi:MAG: hypothetical protein H0X45_14735, partial [Planctomycetes bacterium]|nr:hypothetical protein [Planctomycetota bacterium]